MSEKKILLVSATLKNEAEFWSKTALGMTLKRQIQCHNVDEVEIVYHNSRGLCEVYNQFLIDRYQDYIILFVHDDVIIQDIDLKYKLNRSIEHYDIVGVAGSAEFSLKPPITWYNSPRHKWTGAVSHPVNNNQLQVNNFGASPQRCAVLDGLFMAVNTVKILEKKLRFDEQFTFHFYDLSFCLDAHLAGLAIGTWNIPVIHMSHGSYDSLAWSEAQHKFMVKYSSHSKP